MIETVSDLIEELKKYDGNMPVKKLVLSPSSIIAVKVQDVKKYELGCNGKSSGTYKALVIR